MSKRAEERAFAYQREIGMIDSVSDEHIVARRMGFYDGYRAAEKDNELTWEDAQEICRIEYDMINNDPNDNPEWMVSDKSFYEEVLRRLKKSKNKKNGQR